MSDFTSHGYNVQPHMNKSFLFGFITCSLLLTLDSFDLRFSPDALDEPSHAFEPESEFLVRGFDQPVANIGSNLRRILETPTLKGFLVERCAF